jgi:hypothetical protein
MGKAANGTSASGGLRIERAAIADLSEDPANVRLHPQRNLEAIVASLRRFGQQKPLVVDGKGVVVAGNGTLRAARELGWTEVDVVRTSLVGVDAAAFAIADNRTAELAEWDLQALAETLRAMPEQARQGLGWADYELEPLLRAEWKPEPVGDLPVPEDHDAHWVKFSAAQWRSVAVVLGEVDDEAEAIVSRLVPV